MKYLLSLGLLYPFFSLSLLNAMASSSTQLVDSFSELEAAIREDDLQTFKTQFDPIKHLSKSNDRGLSLLHQAVKAGKSEFMLFLLGKNAPVNARDKNNQTPLHYAARIQNETILQVLLDNQADFELLDFNHDTALHDACSYAEAKCVAALIKKGANYRTINKKGFTPLDLAIFYGYRTVVQEFIQNGIPPQNAVVRSRPIHLAAVCGDLQQLRDLQASGANLNEEIDIEVTAFDIAVRANQIQFVQALLATGSYDVNRRGQAYLENFSPIEIAAARGNTEMLVIFLAHGGDLHAKGNPSGDTLLHIAAENNQKECIEILVQRGADVNGANFSGQTPIMLAVEKGHTEGMESLIRAGVNISGETNGMLLCRAVFLKHISCIQLLLRSGLQPHWLDESGTNALYYAIRRPRGTPTELSWQSTEALLMLLRSWPSTSNGCCRDKLNPFHLVIQHNEVDLLKLLIAHSHLLSDTPDLAQIRESREILIANLVKLRIIYNLLMSPYSSRPNTRDLASRTLLSEPFLNEIADVFLYEMRYGNLSKSLFLIAAKDFVIHHLALNVQAFVKKAKEECLEYCAKKAKTGLFRGGFLKDTTPELSDQMIDFIDKVTDDGEYVRGLIREVIDYNINNPVAGTHQSV